MKIVFVCTGNICRSPTAEGVLRHKLSETGLAETHQTESYGLEGWHSGKAPDSRSLSAAARRGYDLSAIRARKFTPKAFKGADMVLAMDRGHYRQLISMVPEGQADRLFHFMEFAPGASSAPGLARLDVPDPYFGTETDFEQALDIIEAGVTGVLKALKKGLK